MKLDNTKNNSNKSSTSSTSGALPSIPLIPTHVMPKVLSHTTIPLPGTANNNKFNVATVMPRSLPMPAIGPLSGVRNNSVGKVSSGASGLMPAELTGVAPWAAKRNKSDNIDPVVGVSTSLAQGSLIRSHITGYECMLLYMEKCIPKNTNDQNSTSWLEDQAAATPTLLPSLRFHDLVFGKELGKGSFSSVKYCRKIIRVCINIFLSGYSITCM